MSNISGNLNFQNLKTHPLRLLGMRLIRVRAFRRRELVPNRLMLLRFSGLSPPLPWSPWNIGTEESRSGTERRCLGFGMFPSSLFTLRGVFFSDARTISLNSEEEKKIIFFLNLAKQESKMTPFKGGKY